MGNDSKRDVLKENTPRNAGSEVSGKPRNRMNDALAKFIFANEQHKDSTLALINSVFEFEGTKEIVDLEFKDRELDPDRERGKGVVLDVTGISSDGTLVSVEIQIQNLDGMERRVLYYWSLLYGRRLQKGEYYNNLNRTVIICILAYSQFDETVWPHYHSSFAVLNTKALRHRLTDDLEIHFVELPKWHKGDIDRMSRLERWLAYLSPKTTEEERGRLAMAEPAIKTALEAEEVFFSNPNYITAYEQHEKYLRDEQARKMYERKERQKALEECRAEGLAEGLAKGLAKGRAEGLAEGRAEGATKERNRLVLKCHDEKNMSDRAIAELFDMDEAEVHAIILQTMESPAVIEPVQD